MSIIDLLNRVKQKSIDHRGNTDGEVLQELDIFHDSINLQQHMVELSHNTGMKLLIKQVMEYMKKVDEVVYSEQIPLKNKRDVIAMKRAWTKVLIKLTGAKGKLEVIEKQLEYMLEVEKY